LLQILDGTDVLVELGVNFLDPSESNLRKQATRDQGAMTDRAALRAESGPQSDPIFWVLLAVSGTAILANWYVLGNAGGRR
jgi:hypothetical protein